MVVAGAGIGLVAIPQAVDSLITLAQEGSVGAWAGLVGSTAWLAVNAWVWARVALTPPAVPGLLRHPGLREALARGLGVAAFLLVANGLLHAASSVPAGMMRDMGPVSSGIVPLRRGAILLAMAALAFLGATAPAVRRRLGAWQLPPRIVLLVSLLIAVLGMVLYGAWPLAAAGLLPAVPTILFAAAGLICGGVAMTEFGARRHVPLLALLIAGAVTLCLLRDRDVIADNHDLPRLPATARARPGVAEAFGRFLAANPAQAHRTQVVLVAAGGGGLAAADFTATILGDLADASPDFARHIFAISGVSGGALGGAEFVLSQAAVSSGPLQKRCAGGTFRRCLQSALAADFLGPMLGVALYSDFLQRFLPVVVFADRQAAIEQSWDTAWRAAFGNRQMAAPFLDAWVAGHPWPALLLNGTSARTGGRLVTSNLDLDGTLSGDGLDLLTMLRGELAVASAIGTSTRFPYISPVGVIRRAPQGPVADWVADGGYYENLGATTLLDVLDALARIAPATRRDVEFVVIQIISNPEQAGAHMPDAGPVPQWLPRGIAGPATTLLHTRDARAVYAAEALARRVLSLGGLYVPVRLGQSPTGTTAPLGWSLSPLARGVIDAQWTRQCREALLMQAGFIAGDNVPAPRGEAALGTMWNNKGCEVLGPTSTVR